MSSSTAEIFKKVRLLPDLEKAKLVELLLSDLDQPDPEIDRLWATEAESRWEAIQKGGPTRSVQETFGKYR